MDAAKPLTKPLGGTLSHQWAPDDSFLAALRARDEATASAFFQRFAPYVRALLLRVVGPCADLPDLVHDVFVEALGSLGDLQNPEALKRWLTTITVFVARRHIRRKRRRWWLVFAPSDELPEIGVAPKHEENEAVRATYAVLDKLGADERIAFTLRVLEGLSLPDVATACGVSLATVKRRIAKAEERFTKLCSQHPALRAWTENAGAARGEAGRGGHE